MLLLLLLAAQDDAENPAWRAWAKFKEGTSVTMKSDVRLGSTRTESEVTWTLKSIDDKKAVVEMRTVTEINGARREHRAELIHDAREKKREPPKDAPRPEEGEEELEIDGAKMKCRWGRTTTGAGGQKTVSTTWFCDDVPGGMAKQETKSDAMTMTMTATKIGRK